MKHIGIRIESDTEVRLAVAARQMGHTISSYVRYLIQKDLESKREARRMHPY